MQVIIKQRLKKVVDFSKAKGLLLSHRLAQRIILHEQRLPICRLGASNP